jgi:hypothetical protein
MSPKESGMSRMLFPIGIQTFSEIRENGLVYVDKTEYIHNLVSTSKYIFLSRPRRFGKSLLLSTIKAFFEGRRELFEGLAIAEYEHDWEPHPVLHFDFSGNNYNSFKGFESQINRIFTEFENKYEITTDDADTFGVRFRRIIQTAHNKTGKRVVILIDEYDKALLETVDNEPLQEQIRNELRGIYGNLKGQDAHIRFAMLTGVTRFGYLSIFSDLNNLQDISMSEQYAGICGITTEELHKYFHERIKLFSKKEGTSVESVYKELKRNYDGYHFSPVNSPDIYNPFSLLNSLSECNFDDYWFRTGTPTSLVKMIRNGNISLQHLNNYDSGIRALSDVSFNLSNYISVLYQSGYLTIKGYDKEFRMVRLGFPNMEVERGFLNYLLCIYTDIPENETEFAIRKFVLDVRNGRTEDFMQRLQSFFSDFGYDSFDLKNLERHYQDVIYITMKLMGFHTDIEYKTASGRIDMLIRTADYIYIFEFKIDKSAKEALEQIDSKDYMLPFKADGRKIIKIGANFSSEIRSIDSWIIES